ncbi:short chain dehydrogenase reductase family [Stemphylium lycopersici]|nr:short chain dehydrogenase reductase family [Stemphylium lycopersici]
MVSKNSEHLRPQIAVPQLSTQTPNENPMSYGAPLPRQGHVTKKFVLCFDGTGNKFSGTDADSNILKIYRMLDRNGDDQFHYYQPGIGTYVTKANGSMTRTGRWEKFQSWYAKAKDSAVGTSFDQHVMAGYKFLMRYYTPGDDIYFFGFSRGAYTARFLAEMLDHVGLLSAGNEEMCQFAWKTFQKWQCRLPEDKINNKQPGEKSEKQKLLAFMCAFRETFSRPVKSIRFLGLFDTVNSVPAFENAWMQRSRFPYTARSSANVIRHAVSIDERRAKFRQDLISQEKPDKSMYYKRRHKHLQQMKDMLHGNDEDELDEKDQHEEEDRGRRDTLAPPERFRNPHETSGVRSSSRGYSQHDRSATPSMRSFEVQGTYNYGDEDGEQDIQEVWFPGCHADIGGGWPLVEVSVSSAYAGRIEGLN